MHLDPSSPTYIDDYTALIESDVADDFSIGCGGKDHERLVSLTTHLQDLAQEKAVSVIERLREHGKLPQVAELIDKASSGTAQTVALDALTRRWGGGGAVWIGEEFDRIGGEGGRRNVIALSQSVTRIDVPQREKFIDGLAPRASADLKGGWQLPLTETTFTDPDSVAVATVWASLKDDPQAFERVAGKINVGNILAASLNETRTHDWTNGVNRTTYQADETLRELLEGTLQIHSLAIKEKVLSEVGALFDAVKLDGVASRENKAAALDSARPALYALRDQVNERVGIVDHLSFRTPELARQLEAAVAKPMHERLDALAPVLEPLDGYAASRAFAQMQDTSMQAWGGALGQALRCWQNTQVLPQELKTAISRMDGPQLNRLIDLHVYDRSLGLDESNLYRGTLPVMARLLNGFAATTDDRVEVLQHLVTKVSERSVRTQEDMIVRIRANPEATAVATLIAGFRYEPRGFDLALRAVPKGDTLHHVLQAAMGKEATNSLKPWTATYDLGVLRDIVRSASHSQAIEHRQQILQEVRATVTDLRRQLMDTLIMRTEKDTPETQKLQRQFTDDLRLQLHGLESDVEMLGRSDPSSIPGR